LRKEIDKYRSNLPHRRGATGIPEGKLDPWMKHYWLYIY